MKVSKAVIDKILKDNDFSIGLAEIFKIKQVSVELLARRNSGKLTQYAAVEYYKLKGFSLDEIFEKENA